VEPLYDPNPKPEQSTSQTTTTVTTQTTGALITETPETKSRFGLVATVLIVAILLFAAFIAFVISNQNAANPQIITGVLNEDVVADPLEEPEELENTDPNSTIYSSDNFNLTFHYPNEYGTTTVVYDNGEANPRCSQEKITFSGSESEVYVYNDRELGAQTCLPVFGGTSVEGYTNTNAYGNAYSIAVLETSGSFQAVGTLQIVGADETEFSMVFVTQGTSAEDVRDQIDALINKAEFDPEFKESV
jgi:hypothetical protein